MTAEPENLTVVSVTVGILKEAEEMYGNELLHKTNVAKSEMASVWICSCFLVAFYIFYFICCVDNTGNIFCFINVCVNKRSQ